MSIVDRFGRNLAAARAFRRLGQADVAAAAGLDQSYSLSALKPQIAEALASVRLGRPGEKAPRERSSLRDIGGMAHRMAESLRASKEKEDAT